MIEGEEGEDITVLLNRRLVFAGLFTTRAAENLIRGHHKAGERVWRREPDGYLIEITDRFAPRGRHHTRA